MLGSSLFTLLALLLTMATMLFMTASSEVDSYPSPAPQIPGEKIQLHFSDFPNYGSQLNASTNLLEREYLRFNIFPSQGEGKLAPRHEILLERLFRYRDLRKGDVKVRDKFTVKMNSKRLGSTDGWWT